LQQVSKPKPTVVHSAEPKDINSSSHERAPLQAASAQPVQFTPARSPSAEAPAPRPATPSAPAPAPTAMTVKPKRRGGMRFILLVVIPVVAIAGGFFWWLNGGRYVTTDNSYVGAQKVLITPQITGPIVAVHVVEGQKLKAGDPLFDIDSQPYEIALAQARGKLAAAKVEFANLRATYLSNQDQIRMGEDSVKVRQSDFDRKAELVTRGAGTGVDRDTTMATLIQAKQLLELVRNQQSSTIVKLGGSLDAPIESFPDYMQARALVDEAERNLRNTKITAPIDGVATQAPSIELGRVAPAGQPVFAVVANTGLWVDANPKESDMTYVREGQPASVTIDAFPDRAWAGTVCSIAPGTGAQFAILPPQNASGNWVKVVQRVPLRFCFDPKADMSDLRAGMSANLSIDTGRVRTLAGVMPDLADFGRWLIGRADAAKTALAK
jgi:membrane fusion protein, multidrug efflux system